jgi:hypothetical protein
VGPEFLLALQAMRAAYSGIQYCCECLREGSVEIQRVKKTVEGGVTDAKKIYAEVTGLWGWLKGLFNTTEKPAERAVVQPIKPDATLINEGAKKQKAKDEYVDHIPTQDEVVQQFLENLGIWFDKYHFLRELAEKRYTEIFSKDVIDNKDVLELTQLQAELDVAYPNLSTLMSGAPWQLGPIWTQFKEMQDKVKAGQAARKMKMQREKASREARIAKMRDDRIDRNVVIFFTLLGVAYFWLLIGIIANAKA